jgi:hypothetical protein
VPERDRDGLGLVLDRQVARDDVAVALLLDLRALERKRRVLGGVEEVGGLEVGVPSGDGGVDRVDKGREYDALARQVIAILQHFAAEFV